MTQNSLPILTGFLNTYGRVRPAVGSLPMGPATCGFILGRINVYEYALHPQHVVPHCLAGDPVLIHPSLGKFLADTKFYWKFAILGIAGRFWR